MRTGKYITEKGKEKNIKLIEDVYILYNGSVITKFSEELFFGDNGNIKFICNDGDLCDVVIINEYDDYFVDSIDLKNSVIYDKYNKDSKTKQARSLDLSELDEEDIVMANGKAVSISDIAKGDIISVSKRENGEIEKVFVSSNYEEGKISAFDKEEKTVEIDSKEYRVSDNLLKNEGVKVGQIGRFYFNVNGLISAMSLEKTGEWEYGFAIKVWEEEENEACFIKLLTTENQVKIFGLTERFSLDGKREQYTVYELKSALSDNIGFLPQVIRYTIGSNGKVSGIDTVNKGLDEEKSVSLSNIYEKTASVRYIAGSAGFGNRLPVTSKTVFFKVPDESTAKTRGSYSDDKYKVMSVSELKTDTRGYAIIDCLLNLPLLYWASDTYEDNRFALFAKAHADTAVKEFIKPDGSVYHIVNFDTQTGEVKEYPRGQGYESGSSWSRGQAWGVYGFMMSYIHTKDKKYLDASRGIADYIIKNIRERTIVPSDYMQPDSPEIVDASAGAITACGMLELAKYSENGEKYEEFAMRLLRGLYDDCDFSDKNQAIIQSATEMYHGNGTNHHIPIIYSEYFLIEALMKCIGKTDYFMW